MLRCLSGPSVALHGIFHRLRSRKRWARCETDRKLLTPHRVGSLLSQCPPATAGDAKITRLQPTSPSQQNVTLTFWSMLGTILSVVLRSKQWISRSAKLPFFCLKCGVFWSTSQVSLDLSPPPSADESGS